jgi:hypothetical protein
MRPVASRSYVQQAGIHDFVTVTVDGLTITCSYWVELVGRRRAARPSRHQAMIVRPLGRWSGASTDACCTVPFGVLRVLRRP